jgi:predicted SprT family Zn-dependent metalloprotease
MKTLDFKELLEKVPDLKNKVDKTFVEQIKQSQINAGYKCLGRCEREFISETNVDSNIVFCSSCNRIMEI